MRGEWSPEVGRGDSKHPSLPLARAERKPLDRKRKLTPRRCAIHLTFTSFNKRPKQPLLCRVCVAEPLRVPLDAEAEVRVRLFQCFHNAVLAEGGYF